MNILANNMRKCIWSFFAILALSTFAAAFDGVKGGYRTPTSQSNNLVAFPASENGTCYKRLPYNQAVAANTTGHLRIVPGSFQEGGTQHDSRGWITVIDCCDGFLRNITSGKCETHCDEGCLGGKCTGPNICTCEEGWLPERGVCKPYCHFPCKRDAYCFAPNVCECKLGFEEINGECKPICPGNCRNGDCIAPRVCRCKPGYILNDLKECMPVCEGGCPHGECTSPGICTCYSGYTNEPGDRESCVPECANGCLNGVCTSPGICTCRPGNNRDTSGRCVPTQPQQCRNGCTNGQCVGPNDCVCNSGFNMNPRTQTCVPSHNANVDTWNTHATSVTPLGNIRPEHSSQCSDGCLYGQCVGPNQCVCTPGFHLEMIPVQNSGHTTYSQACISNIDSTVVSVASKTHHNPSSQCSHGCVNGRCVGLNQCVCSNGYHLDTVYMTEGSTSTFVQRCIPVYNNVGTYTTTPSSSNLYPSLPSLQCPDGCPNGQCIGPNQCACNYGFTMSSISGMCLPFHASVNSYSTSTPASSNPYHPSSRCPNGCQNGRCVGSNQCICDPGFSMNPGNGMCIPSHLLQYNYGTNEPTSRNMYRTSSLCRDSCPNGACLEPNVCVCNPGFTVSLVTHTCTPSDNSATDHYGQHGHSNNDNVNSVIGLSASCDKPCLNGECTGYNTCTCHRGYTHDPQEQNKCIPLCHGGCINGICTAPNFCICNRGYVKDRSVKGSQTCVPQ